jgi:hypothetical protein
MGKRRGGGGGEPRRRGGRGWAGAPSLHMRGEVAGENQGRKGRAGPPTPRFACRGEGVREQWQVVGVVLTHRWTGRGGGREGARWEGPCWSSVSPQMGSRWERWGGGEGEAGRRGMRGRVKSVKRGKGKRTASRADHGCGSARVTRGSGYPQSQIPVDPGMDYFACR